jgi:hypothetical protein
MYENAPQNLLGKTVVIKVSLERGQVIGVASFLESQPDALVRYRANDGRAVEAWWKLSAFDVVGE